jgi:hypothetical protein
VLFISASACSVFSVSLLTCLLSVLCGFFFVSSGLCVAPGVLSCLLRSFVLVQVGVT